VAAAEVWPDIAEALYGEDKYRDVYQLFVADRLYLSEIFGFAPTVDAEGELDRTDQWQADVRRTLDWTPLRAGADYAADAETPLDEQEIPADAELLPPNAFLRRYEQGQEIAVGVDPPEYDIYIGAAEVGFTIEAPRNQLGLRLIGRHNWELADNHWIGVIPDHVTPLYDWEATVATVAWETDQRFGLEWAAPDAKPSDGVLEIEVPDAHLWVLAPETVVGVSPEGELRLSPETSVVLRQDTDRLLFALAGVLSRYYGARARAEITFRGLLPYAGALGQILRAVDTGGEVTELAAPVTAVEWQIDQAGAASTTILAGFAG
jgi:hypothetical protein